MATQRQKKIAYLKSRGLTHNEALAFTRDKDDKGEIIKPYSLSDFRSLPYLRAMLTWRQLYVSNLKKKGYTADNIAGAIANLYYRFNWQNPDGTFDPWKMIKRFRKKSIADHAYNPKQQKGSHHGQGISKGDVKGQKARSQTREQQREYRARITEIYKKLSTISDPQEREKLMSERRKLERKLE